MDIDQACNSLVDKNNASDLLLQGMSRKFEALNSTLETIIGALIPEVPEDLVTLENNINAVQVSVDKTLNTAIKDLMALPCFTDMVPPAIRDKISSYADAASFPPVFSNKLLKSIREGVYTNIYTASSTLSAGVAAAAISEYEKAITDSGLSDILDNLDYVYTCLVQNCGLAPTNHAAIFRAKFNLDSNNKLDSSILPTWNPDATVVTQLSSVKSTLSGMETKIKNLSF